MLPSVSIFSYYIKKQYLFQLSGQIKFQKKNIYLLVFFYNYGIGDNIMEIKKNQIIKLEITAMSALGSGIGRTDDNRVVFIPDSAIGDVLEVKILKVQKTLAYGKIERVIVPSSDRIETDCMISEKCGGCTYRHISYESELKIKQQKVRDAIKRIGKLDENLVSDIVSSTKVEGYRNKAQIPVSIRDGKIEMGFYSKHSHRINTCFDCKLSPGIFNEILISVYDFLSKHKEIVYDENTHSGYFRHLYLRLAEYTNEVMVCFVINGKKFPHQDELVSVLTEKYKEIKSILINVNRKDTNVVLGKENILLYGKETIKDKLCGLDFEISPNSFYQVNRSGAEILYGIAKEYAKLDSNDTLLDLYCGTGTIGLSMADSCKKVIGIEIVEDAIQNAIHNAKINNIHNAEFICADAIDTSENISADVIVVDPPRKGLDISVINTVVKINPIRVVYVSCDPATLARDLNVFAEKGYIVEKITPVDMFPRTFHVETVCLMSRVIK